jgi:hypothetical protein
MRSEASFAALAGTSPVDAERQAARRHRLNRGDRQLNRALHVIAPNGSATTTRPAPTTSGSRRRQDHQRGTPLRQARAFARHFYRRLAELQRFP